MFRHTSIRAALLLILGSAAFSAPAQAQSIPSPYRFIEERHEAGVFAGYFATGTGRFGIGPKSGPAFGARYGLGISGPFGLEAVATAVPTQRDVVNPARPEGDRVVEEAESFLVFLEARLRFALTGRRTWNGIQPYIVLGAGLGLDAQGAQVEDQLLVSADQFDFGTRFVGSGGAGGRVILTRRLTLRLDTSFLLYQIRTPGGFDDPARNLGLGTVPESEWVTGSLLSLGLAYRF